MSENTQTTQVKTLKQAEQQLAAAYRTYQFFTATKAEKRVMVAEDTIAQLKAKKLVAESGTYVQPQDEQGSKCTVCALGACFVSIGKLDNGGIGEEDEIYGGYNQEMMHERLSPYFSQEQLDLIESAFERDVFCSDEVNEDRHFAHNKYGDLVSADSGFGYQGNPKTAIGRAINFGHKYSDDRKRLEAIMQNIIDNKGTFKP